MPSRPQQEAAASPSRLLGRVALGLLGLFAPLLRAGGRWLMANDEVQHADAIFVHHSKPPFGGQEAAELWESGWAPEIWIAAVPERPAERELQRFGVHRPAGHEMEHTILLTLAVRADAIRILEGSRRSTLGELEAVAAELRRRGQRRVILVSAKHHGRRIRALWRGVGDDDLEAVVRGASRDPFDPASWWRDSGTAAEVFHEMFGLLNAWLGSPLTKRAMRTAPHRSAGTDGSD